MLPNKLFELKNRSRSILVVAPNLKSAHKIAYKIRFMRDSNNVKVAHTWDSLDCPRKYAEVLDQDQPGLIVYSQEKPEQATLTIGRKTNKGQKLPDRMEFSGGMVMDIYDDLITLTLYEKLKAFLQTKQFKYRAIAFMIALIFTVFGINISGETYNVGFWTAMILCLGMQIADEQAKKK